MFGRVVSLFENHGFIQNKEGLNHYFNPKLMGEGVPFSALEVGSEVLFSSRPSPRGPRAYCVLHADKMKNPFIREPGVLYAERIGSSRRVIPNGVPPEFLEKHRLHSVMTMRSSGYMSARRGVAAFLRAVHMRKANMVFDLKVAAIDQIFEGRTLTTYEWHARVGVYVVLKKVETQAELDRVTAETERLVHESMTQLRGLQIAIDLKRTQGAPFTQRSTGVSEPTLDPLQRLPEDSPEISPEIS